MPRVEAVSARRVQPAQQARRIQSARTEAVAIQQRSEEARKEVTRKAADDVKRHPATGSNLDVLA